MDTLRELYPEDRFTAFMKPYCVNIETGELISLANKQIDIQPGEAPPHGMKVQYMPRIRCLDCPGKVYTAVRERVMQDFEVHLKNRKHRDQVRVNREDEKAGKEGSRSKESRR